MRRSAAKVAMTALVATLGVAACAGNPSGAGGKVTINMVESLTNPARTTLLKSQIADFEKANPTIHVNLISPPTDTADQKIRTMLQSGTGIDALEVRDMTVAEFSKNGWLYDMTSDVNSWSGWQDIIDNAKNAVAQNGHIYHVPYGEYASILFYRTDLTQSAGFSGPPQSWADVLKDSEAINNPGKHVYGYSLRGGDNNGVEVTQMLEAYNADNLDSSNAFLLKDGKTIFSSPESVQAMKDRLELFHKGSPPSSIAWGYPEMVQGFSSGLTAYLLQTQEVIATVGDSTTIKQDQWSTAPMLQGPTGKAPQVVSPAGWGVAKSSKHAAEAVKLVEFLTSGPRIIQFDKDNGMVPAVKSAADDPFFKTGRWAPYITMNSDPSHYPVITEPRNVTWWAEWKTKSDADSQKFLLGKISPADLMADWDAYWTAKLKSGK
jgi:multiple sugar transport system substrate-binding protein